MLKKKKCYRGSLLSTSQTWLSRFLPSAVPRLIELCRSPTERNNSDSVLVACLVSASTRVRAHLNRAHTNDSMLRIQICHPSTQTTYFSKLLAVFSGASMSGGVTPHRPVCATSERQMTNLITSTGQQMETENVSQPQFLQALLC